MNRRFNAKRMLMAHLRSCQGKPEYAVPTYKRLLDIMFVAHLYGYKEMKGHELMDLVQDLHPEVHRASCSAALAGLSGRGYATNRKVKLLVPGRDGRTEFRYHKLTLEGVYKSRFLKRSFLKRSRA